MFYLPTLPIYVPLKETQGNPSLSEQNILLPKPKRSRQKLMLSRSQPGHSQSSQAGAQRRSLMPRLFVSSSRIRHQLTYPFFFFCCAHDPAHANTLPPHIRPRAKSLKMKKFPPGARCKGKEDPIVSSHLHAVGQPWQIGGC